MSEQFAFQQAGRNRRRSYAHEGAVAPGTEGLDGRVTDSFPVPALEAAVGASLGLCPSFLLCHESYLSRAPNCSDKRFAGFVSIDWCCSRIGH